MQGSYIDMVTRNLGSRSELVIDLLVFRMYMAFGVQGVKNKVKGGPL